MSNLFTPLQVGDLTLPNRILMAPLTRSRAGESRVPNAMMTQYYGDRASAGLIISEATSICPMGVGYADTPGIWSKEQIEGWKKVTTAVHEKNGRIFLQLWHVGRISDPMFLNGELPVAPSAITPKGHVSLVRPQKAFVTPRALTTEEIPPIVEAYRQAAQNAKEAGFDGVEVHAANGYLLDQFLQDSTNHRNDQYGGSLENRARFLLEVTDAIISVWGAGRVGVHLAPRCDTHDMGDSNPLATFSYVAKALGERKVAFILARERQGEGYIGDKLKQIFGGVYIANQELTPEMAEQLIETGKADAVAFGKLFIANPDLPERFSLKAPLNVPDAETFYANGNHGYNDYPRYKEVEHVNR
ncbi:MAG: NADH:flavin oxidoreductase/NADH oxidase [Gammaproteobacteria bacterium]|jgi:2,4-dienoyl-CoA reductase-like NADH-dependent reductase (Old Yellow Enzyme family)|nr:NADH:flavin oxidoreductase/NADH oxidase [Gammaproteobacteria bacterium]